MHNRKSRREKMDNPGLPKFVDVPRNLRQRYPDGGAMLVPSPRDVEAVMRAVPPGRVITVGEIREHLARKYAVAVTCPLTTGIFVWLAAEAAEEPAPEGGANITPYWRVVKNDGSLNPKFPGGVKAQAEKLRAEGHTIDTHRGVPRVVRRDVVREGAIKR